MVKTITATILCSVLLSGVAIAQVKTIDLKGKNYTVCTNFPEDIIGEYKYDGSKSGEPKIVLNSDGTGTMQSHIGTFHTDKNPVVPITKIKFWIDCDEKGEIRKLTGPTGNYQVTILYQFLDGERTGQYSLTQVTVAKDGFGLPIKGRPEITGPYAKMLNERYKPLK